MSVLFAVAVLLLPGDAARVPAAGMELVGRWEGVTRSLGGISSALELQPDGTAASTVIASIDTTYRRVDDRLLIGQYDPATGKECEEPVEIAFEGSVLVQKGWELFATEARPEARLVRISLRSPADPLIGTWVTPRRTPTPAGDLEQSAYSTFTPDGRLLFRFPMRTDCGSWSFSDGVLTLTIRGQTQRLRTSFAGELLVIEPETGGRETRLRRSSALPDGATTRSAAQAD